MSSFITSALDAAQATAITSPASTITFDAVVREVHKGSAQPTDHPVEDGAVVTDHVIDQPDELELNGIISNTIIAQFASAVAAPSVPGGDPRTRAEDAYQEFQRLRRTATLVAVSTSLRDYEDMLIISESVTRDRLTGKILDISIRLREFRKATVEAVEAPEPEEPVHKADLAQGRKQTEPAPPEVEEKASSTLRNIINAGAGA